MSTSSHDPILDDLVGRVLARRRAGSRVLVGIAGCPGAGKSTLAARLVDALVAATTDGRPVRPAVVPAVVPMDGFHLADRVLDELGRRDRKGAPDTFDGDGYLALLERLRVVPDQTVYAPSFDRDLEQPLANALAVPPDVDVVVTEGNYLLVDRPPWSGIRELLDEAWYVHVAHDERRRRLHDRHVTFGKTPHEATAWMERVDDPNARLVEAARHRADLVVDLAAHGDPG